MWGVMLMADGLHGGAKQNIFIDFYLGYLSCYSPFDPVI